MGHSLFLAQLLGPILIVIGISLLFNEKFFGKIMKEMRSQNMISYLAGIISMFFGLYVLLTVNNDGYLYQALLLFFGFAATIKGALLIIFPKFMKKASKDLSFILKFLQYFGFAYIAIGAYFCFIAY